MKFVYFHTSKRLRVISDPIGAKTTMKTFVLYGVPDGTPDDYVERLAAVLGVSFIARESSHLGEYHRSETIDQENFSLRPNFVPEQEDRIEEKHPEYPVLLYVNGTDRADEPDRLLTAAIPSAKQLKREGS